MAKKKEYKIALEARKKLIKNFPGNPLFRDLTDDEVLVIVRAYARAEKAFEAEEAAERERKEKKRQAERESEKDINSFPGEHSD